MCLNKSDSEMNLKLLLKKLFGVFLGCFILFQVYIAMRLYLVASCVVPTYSMSPTLVAGDYLITSLCIPGRRIIKKDTIRPEHYIVQRKKGIRDIREGDVVVFNFPYSKGKERIKMDFNLYFCKRCVATPGKLYRWQWNGNTDSIFIPHQGETLSINSLNIRHYSRCIEYETGWMPELINGQVIHADTIMHSYHFKSNYYFMRGDNFADSYDSRFWGILPEDFILGVGLFTWFSKDKETKKIRWERMLKKL